MDVHQLCITQSTKMLRNLAAWLEEAESFAKERDFEADRWLEMRLAPDQFALVRQVQSACDTAKFMASRLGGPEAPSFPDDEKSMVEVQKRISDTVAYLEGVTADMLEGAESKKVTLPFLPEGAWVTGEEYVVSFALPNLYFHVSTAYAILRERGVALGKRAFIGGMDVKGG